MIEKIVEVRGIGMLHDSVPADGLVLSKAVAIYGENGRGKSTCSHLLRSLSDNDCTEVLARKALRQEDEPHAEVVIDGVGHTLSQGSWDRICDGVYVFDDQFVDHNVCAGGQVGREHLEHLLAFALSQVDSEAPEDVDEALDDCLDGVNSRLRSLLAGFEIATLERHEGDDGARADFTLRVMANEVPLVAAEPASPSFSTALSPADQRLLGLALFFWALDGDAELPRKTVVLDDPARGLDRRRKTKLAEALAGFVGRGQTIVLSHDAEFILMLRERGFDQVLQLSRSGVYCVFEDCDIDAILAADYSDRPPTPGEFMALL